MRLRDWLAVVLGCVLFVGCGDDDAPPVEDGGTEDSGTEIDAEVPLESCTPSDFAWQRARVDSTPGVERRLDLFVHREACEDLPITFTSSSAGVIAVPEPTTIDEGNNLVNVVSARPARTSRSRSRPRAPA